MFKHATRQTTGIAEVAVLVLLYTSDVYNDEMRRRADSSRTRLPSRAA